MKVNIGLCLVGVVIGEFIGAKQGLGYLIIYASQVFICEGILIQYAVVIPLAFFPSSFHRDTDMCIFFF